MTDEEIEKETEEWYVILNMNCKYEICRRCPKSGLFKGSLKECDDWIKQKQKDEMKDKISFALKDPILQQAFEIICKENAELKQYAKALEETDKTNILHCIKVNGQLYKAKEILRRFLDAKSIEETCVAESEADKFLMEVKNDRRN